MAKLYPLLFCFLLLATRAVSQTPADSIPSRDTAAIRGPVKDTAAPVVKQKREIPKPVPDTLAHHHHPDTLSERTIPVYTDSLRFSNKNPRRPDFPSDWMGVLKSIAWFNFSGGKTLSIREEQYQSKSYDGFFYLLVGMLFFFAIVKLVFGKYLGNILTLFFRVSMRQQQIREQVLQSPFPSLLLNLLFILSAGLYASFLMTYEHYGDPEQFWNFFAYGCLVLALIYLIKFVSLKITGWIFNIQRTVETYLFIVFVTNKIIGIFLLPFLVIISLSGPLVSMICFTLSAVMIGIFYVYRIIASFKTLRKEIKISGLHFFLYLCAFEIAPLLLIYKVLLTYLEKAN
ncbi:MAG: DUF4271 domain-containing protein [Bacteroidota bacterium]|nr:DUF4271 domain-containing protein [Bacteroidota bacterium]